ncbi:peptidoglycan D,D-transpeptidase FtsI family protein [Blautia sp. MSJ-19]|uniref:peptidoglycan D,D-transpeptidase FtsI family protein n=1 Tax=Blautia sp. MSJ-19 TaxID=2841517 RepID=UPI001C0EAA12|nr:penicillin-binding transpeptidase domain-containing protein [Blautia sp. MSJ-19]MBU5481938.1 penicillin-binding protein 2 [Blautia sp. MSJ-19]
MGLIGYLIYFNTLKSDDFINSPYNTRQDSFSDRVVRGKIISSDGEVLAQTNVSEDGTEERSYPYGSIFAHVVGYDTNGKSGLESEANFQLLSSHDFFLNQIRNEFMGTKNTGDTVVSTLNADLQTTAYNSLGDRKGAVVALEPSTGKILAMVSKPDFDPNTIAQNWDTLVNDETNSSLLNRATMGQYPPGSTFKVVTALDYFRSKGSFNGFSFDCQGTITKEEHTIQCYGGKVHGTEDFYSAFANSCNCAFAEIGTELGGASLLKTSEDLLFNQKLPLNSYRKSSFTLNGSSGIPLIMQTAIGQGNTLVSPMHMALITSAIANNGVLMKPYLIDKVVNDSGDTVTTTEPATYKNLMTSNEAALLGKLMQGVVQNGTATALNGRGYSVAGKTGSAEYDENGSSHSWFIGYSNVDDPDLVVAIIVEGGGTGSEAAVPIAADLFDAYYFD